MNESMNQCSDEGDSRTAPATPGLLITSKGFFTDTIASQAALGPFPMQLHQ